MNLECLLCLLLVFASSCDGEGPESTHETRNELAKSESDKDSAKFSQNNVTYFEGPSLTIRGTVIPRGNKTEKDTFQTFVSHFHPFEFLFDTWWKLLLWSLFLLSLLLICCYVTRICYLCFDCCADPFWGCCPPLSQGCHNCLTLKCCQDEEYLEVTYDRRKPRVRSYYEDSVMPSLGEAQPQVYDNHYFSLFSMKNGGRYELASQMEKNQEVESDVELQEMSPKNGNRNGGLRNGNANKKKKSDLVIEHGHMGRYQALPEAQSELVPVQIRNSFSNFQLSCKRMSRSMESFGRASKDKEAKANRQQQTNNVSAPNSHSHHDVNSDSTSVPQNRLQHRHRNYSSSSTSSSSSSSSSSKQHRKKRRKSKRKTTSTCDQASQTDLNDYGTEKNGTYARVRSFNKCPLPKSPRRNPDDEIVTVENNGGSTCYVQVHHQQNGIKQMEREILFGKETNIMI